MIQLPKLLQVIYQQFIKKSYDPHAYWNARENPNTSAGESSSRVAFDVNYIRQSIGNDNKVMELGPGVGRTFPAYRSGDRIVTLDISNRYHEKLCSVAQSLNLKLDFFHLNELDASFPFQNGEFSVGVASQVLMHIPPNHIKHTISELVRVCHKVVVITKYSHGLPTKSLFSASHVFNHDYFTLSTELGCDIHNLILKEGRLYFTIRPSQ